MAWSNDQSCAGQAWELARLQHGVVARSQLFGLGFSRRAIEHRLRTGRLHQVRYRAHPWRGVYAVGRPALTQRGLWMAAVLRCGTEAFLSHETAAALWGIRRANRADAVELTVPGQRRRRVPGIRIHRRSLPAAEDRLERDRIPVASPLRTLLDLATRLGSGPLEAAVNEADKLDLIDPETLRAELEDCRGVRGVAPLRAILNKRTFALTDSELERRFLPLTERAGLSRPETGARLNGFKVDFYWPELGLVVETDGLRYHRTPAQQARDRERDQAHAAAGLTPLRFTHSQVAFEPDRVVGTLHRVIARLRANLATPP